MPTNALRAVLGDRAIAYRPILSRVSGNSMRAGILLGQLLYWDGVMRRAKGAAWDGWFYKSGKEIEQETALRRYDRDLARLELEWCGFIQTAVRGVPATVHFKINHDALALALDWLAEFDADKAERARQAEQDDEDGSVQLELQFADSLQTGLQTARELVCTPSANQIADSPQTIHKITHEISNENSTSSFGGDGANVNTSPNIFALYENIGLALNPIIADILKEAEQEYPFPWIQEAFRRAASANKRNWKYINAILENFKTNGGIDSPRNNNRTSPNAHSPPNGNGNGNPKRPVATMEEIQKNLR